MLAIKGKEAILARQALSEKLEVATDMIAGQLAQGVMSDGTFSDFQYSPFTVAIKKTRTGLSSVTDHLTNYDTGESYRQLYGKVEGDNVEYGTLTDKEESISERMEGKAFGLAPENKRDLIKLHVKPAFMQMVRDALKI